MNWGFLLLLRVPWAGWEGLGDELILGDEVLTTASKMLYRFDRDSDFP